MTIGKLPATGPSSSPTRKNQEASDNNRAGFQQAKPATDRVPPKPFQPKSGASPKPSPAPSGRTGAPDAPPAGTGGSAKTFWAQQDAASAKKPASRPPQNSPKTGAAPADASPPPSKPPTFGKPAPAPSQPADAPAGGPQAARNFWNQQKTQAGGKPTPLTQQPAPSIGKPAPAPSKPTGRSAPRPQNESVPVLYARPRQQPAQNPGLTQFQKDLAGWSSSKVALLSKEYVSTITAQHIRLLSRETTELYLNGVNLTRDALQELQKLPIELLSLNSASGLQPHDEPIALPRSLRALAIIGDALPTKALLAEAGRHPGLLSVQAWRAQANDADAIALAQSSSLKTIDLASNGVTGKGANALIGMPKLTALDLSSNLIGSNGSTQLTASRIPASSRLSRVDLSDNPDLSEASIPALYRLPLQALNLSGTNVTRYPEDDRKPPQTARTTPGPDGTEFIEPPEDDDIQWKDLRTLWLDDTRLFLKDQTAYQAWQRVLFGNRVSDISLARAGMGEYLDDLGQHPSLATVNISETDIPPGQLRALAQERLPAVLIMSGCGLTSAHVEELTAGPDADPRLRQLWIDGNPELDERDHARLLHKYPNLTLGLGDDDHAKACFNRLAPPLRQRVRLESLERDFPLSPEQPS